MWWATLILGWLIFAAWSVRLGPSIVMLLCRTLERKTARFSQRHPLPLVSVIVPARDEADRIEATLRSLLAADYPNLEIVAVDDRSGDQTGSVMDRLADTDSRLRVIHISQLPPDWMGKTHAMHVATQSARGEYLLFTDGDVLFGPDVIRRSVGYVRHHQVDHLCLMPTMIPGGYCENALVAFFGLIFAAGTFAWLASTRLKWAYVGIGAFNMLRRAAFEQVGGLEPIRLDVLDDIKLGKMIKRFGFRQQVLLSGEALRVKWQDSAWGVIRGLEKNAFASQDYSIAKLMLTTLGFVVLFVLPYVAIFAVRDELCYPYAATLVLLHVVYGVLGWTFGGGWRVLPALPFAGLAMLFAFWRSAIITLRQGGVRWRETFYPLNLLRAHLYR